MAQITKEQVADTLEAIARLLELKDENPFKIRAYTNAARALETWSGDLAKVVAEKQLGTIAGIGSAIAEKITEFVTTGQLPYYDKLKAEFPPGLFELFELQGLGPEEDQGALGEARRDQSCGAADGLAATAASRSCRALGRKPASICSPPSSRGPNTRAASASATSRRMPSGCSKSCAATPDVIQVSVAGSYRRRKEIVGDLDFIVATNAPERSPRFSSNTRWSRVSW
jgi:DNA polymerase (family 10)